MLAGLVATRLRTARRQLAHPLDRQLSWQTLTLTKEIPKEKDSAGKNRGFGEPAEKIGGFLFEKPRQVLANGSRLGVSC